MENKKIDKASPENEGETKLSVVQVNAAIVSEHLRIAQFRGRPMVEVKVPFRHFVPLFKDKFDQLVYPILGGLSRSRMGDIFSYMSNVAADLSDNDTVIGFGLPHGERNPAVWDMVKLEWTDDIKPGDCIWRSPYSKAPAPQAPTTAPVHVPFILSLAGGDAGVYDDIMQSLAPLLMDQKPDGVIWWVGDGANGKSTLMDALYRIFPGQLSSITVKRLTDGRDTPGLNGTLANVVKESSEGRVEDTEIYKAVGTHENFRVHKFHSQDDIEIRGNVHHIFSANTVPTFNDKGWSARRRTFIIPFTQRFKSDPEFEQKTFTEEMFGQLIAEMARYAVRLREQGLTYKWSAETVAAKLEYDTDANNAEEYAKHIIGEGVVAFESFAPVYIDYQNWCADEGFVPLGVTNMRRALQAYGFERVSVRVQATTGFKIGKMYRLKSIDRTDLQSIGMSRPGMYTLPGFQPKEDVEVPDFREPETPVEQKEWYE